jgi:hypothetical protein
MRACVRVCYATRRKHRLQPPRRVRTHTRVLDVPAEAAASDASWRTPALRPLSALCAHAHCALPPPPPPPSQVVAKGPRSVQTAAAATSAPRSSAPAGSLTTSRGGGGNGSGNGSGRSGGSSGGGSGSGGGGRSSSPTSRLLQMLQSPGAPLEALLREVRGVGSRDLAAALLSVAAEATVAAHTEDGGSDTSPSPGSSGSAPASGPGVQSVPVWQPRAVHAALRLLDARPNAAATLEALGVEHTLRLLGLGAQLATTRGWVLQGGCIGCVLLDVSELLDGCCRVALDVACDTLTKRRPVAGGCGRAWTRSSTRHTLWSAAESESGAAWACAAAVAAARPSHKCGPRWPR